MDTPGINAENVGAFDDGKEVASLGPPAPSDNLAKCIRCRRAMPISSDELAAPEVIDGGDDWCCEKCLTLVKIDFPELVKPDTAALLETILESRWIVQSGQCATCGVGVVDTFDALDMDDEGRLFCIRCSQSDYEEWCQDHDDNDEQLS